MAYIYIGLQFGFYTAGFIFIAFKGGSYLDERLGMYPIFTSVAVLMAIVYSFYSLYYKIKLIDEHRNKKNKNKNQAL